MKEWKRVILFAIVPALIAGVFAVAPKLYDEFTEPKAILEYNITKGPILKDNGEHKAIYAIQVINNGKKPLSAINALLKSSGKIGAINTYEDTGLSPKILQDPPSVTVETLHPGESFTISLMLITPDKENKLDFVLRSKEILGTKFKPTNESKNMKLDFVSGLTSAFSVFVMAIIIMYQIRSKNSLAPFTSYKQDLLFYICAKLDLTEEAVKLGLNDGITYLRYSDILYAIAIKSPSSTNKVICALKCVLLNSSIALSSRAIIKRHIEVLEADNFSENEMTLLDKKSSSVSNHIDLRKSIDAYISDPDSIATESGEPNK
ncbi:TPA: hypothetical protein VGT13_002188 [Shewanella algae]|nr:hypothetical protein [Shewanella algae]